MEAFFVTTAVVAIGEIGDKTQLLSLVLAARYRRPLPIILGILCATVANHALAAAAGIWLRGAIDPRLLRWVVGLSFLAIAAWALVPDEAGRDAAPAERYGVFLVTLVAFFLAAFVGSLWGALLIARRQGDGLTALPFGTLLAPAAMIAFLWGNGWIGAYMRLVRGW